MYPLSSDPEFSFALNIALSMSNGGAAATGEVLRAAGQIVPGDIESWYTEFKFLADAVHNMAANATSQPSVARDAYFRAATYYREADFFLHGNASDPRLITLWESHLADYSNAISLLPIPGEKITVQGPNYTIPVYFYPAQGVDRDCEKVPTILAGTGYDGAQEEMYPSFGKYVNERGWNFATYEGPGQATVRRFQNVGFTPDWWEVVTPVVDYLSSRPDVDISKVALLGESFGGALAPLAASREHRLAAVISIDGLYSVQETVFEQIPAAMANAFKTGNATLFDEVTAVAYQEAVNGEFGEASTEFRWFIDQSLWSFDVTSPFEWLTDLGAYTLDGIYGNITCPVFIGSGQNDTLGRTQADAAWAAVSPGQGYYYEFMNMYGSGLHCQIGAEPYMNMVIWDWVAGVFDGNWTSGNGTTVY
jgi:pimeloyl-ACP methyl ester carboxylesterase